MQAIKTKYLPCTNFKGSRIKATCEAGSVIVDYDYSLNLDENHAYACHKLLLKLDWTETHHGHMVGGSFGNDGNDMYWVFGKGSPVTLAVAS